MIDEAVRDFIHEYIDSELTCYRGWENRTSLDKSTDYAVISVLGAERRGTNVHSWTDTAETHEMLATYRVQVDFIGDSALDYANKMCLLARDIVAISFFEEKGYSVHYATDPMAHPRINQRQWETRYTLELEMAGWVSADVPIDFFEAVDISIENIDVHHQEV